MTNLDSILRSWDITLPTKVHLVKAMVFPVVMYGCESWTIKKAERRRMDAFKLWCWRRLLRVPCTERRPNQSILKEINPEYSLEGLMLKLKLQYFGHLMRRTDSLEKTLMLGGIGGRRRRGRQRMRWLDGITDSMDMSLRKGSWWWTGRPGVLQSMGSQRVRHDWATELNWTLSTPTLHKKQWTPNNLPTCGSVVQQRFCLGSSLTSSELGSYCQPKRNRSGEGEGSPFSPFWRSAGALSQGVLARISRDNSIAWGQLVVQPDRQEPGRHLSVWWLLSNLSWRTKDLRFVRALTKSPQRLDAGWAGWHYPIHYQPPRGPQQIDCTPAGLCIDSRWLFYVGRAQAGPAQLISSPLGNVHSSNGTPPLRSHTNNSPQPLPSVYKT